MKLNTKTLLAAIIVAVLGIVADSLTNGTIQFSANWQYLVPIISAVLVALTKHIQDTGTPTPTPPDSASHG